MEIIRRIALMVLMGSWASLVSAASEPSVIQITPEELENYEFEIEETPFEVSSPSIGQRYIFDRSRRTVRDLLARTIGSTRLTEDESDLGRLQVLIDRRVIRKADVETWQALGVVFGDVLVGAHGLKWVMYEDELGASKALQWRDTANFVFPVTVFSKRVQFNESIDVASIYASISADIEAFKEAANRPRMPARQQTEQFEIEL